MLPNIEWKSDVGYLNFVIQVNTARNNIIGNGNGLSLIYYNPDTTRSFPTTAVSGEIISLYSYWYYTDANIICNFTHVPTGNSVTISAFNINNQCVSCVVPYFNNVISNDIIQVSSKMEGVDYNSEHSPAFFYYIDVSNQEYYDTFDVKNLFNDFAIIEGSNVLSFVWIPYDKSTSRSLINMTSLLSSVGTRTKIQSIKPLIISTDQELMIEFLINSNQVENLMQMWILLIYMVSLE